MRRGRHVRALPAAALAAAVLAGTLAVTLQGCSDDHANDRRYTLPAERLRDGETAEQGRTGRSADMQYTVLTVTDGITEVMGTHASMGAHGRFLRIRILAVNTGRDTQVYDAWAQRLVLTDGRELGADINSTMVKRQPDRLSFGAGMRAEFDLWFDVPKGVKTKAVKLVGSPTVGMTTDPDPATLPVP